MIILLKFYNHLPISQIVKSKLRAIKGAVQGHRVATAELRGKLHLFNSQLCALPHAITLLLDTSPGEEFPTGKRASSCKCPEVIEDNESKTWIENYDVLGNIFRNQCLESVSEENMMQRGKRGEKRGGVVPSGEQRGTRTHGGSRVERACFMMGVWRLKRAGDLAMRARAEMKDRTGFQRMGKGWG